jgi:hypothetical protein
MKKHTLFLFLVVCSGLIYGQPKFHSVPKQNMQGINMNNPAFPNTFSLPTQPVSTFNLSTDDNPLALSGFLDGYYSSISSAYPGFTPVFAHQIVNDKAGNLLFFIVDNFIYNKNGFGFEIDPNNPQGDCHVLKDGVFNPYYPSDNLYLHNDIIILPVPNSCNEFYIIYALVPSGGVALNYWPNIYFKKLTYISDTEIQMTEENQITCPDIQEHFACNNCDGFSMDVTAYDIIYNDHILIIQWQEFLWVTRISETITETAIPFIPVEYRFRTLEDRAENCLGGKRPDIVITSDNNNSVTVIYSSFDGLDGSVNPAIRYFKFSRDFSSLDINTFTYDFIEYNNGLNICGMEISPNKNYLYVSFMDSNDLYYFDVSDFINNTGPIPASYTALGLTGNYRHSYLETFADGKIYVINHNNLTDKGTYTRIDNPNSPLTTTHYLNCFEGIEVTKTFVANLNLPDFKRYIFNHQIDNSDYETGYPIYASDQPDWNSIGSNVTWSPGAANNPFGSESGIVYFDEDFVIPSNKYVKLINMEFYFANGKKALVNIGSTLRLENTKLTAETTCTPTAMWNGVYLEGNPGVIQNTANQGTLSMAAGSEISNAITGVTVEGGAICKIYAGDFINNKTGIYFYPHTYSSLPNYNASFVQLANFTINGALNNGNTPLYMIYMNGVKGINITSCNFFNSRGSDIAAVSRGYAIRSNSTNFKLSNCEVEGWNYGCYSTLGTPRILDNQFAGNFKSIYSASGVSVEITGNDFNGEYDFASGTATPYSVHVLGNGTNNTLYKFEENTIQNGVVGVQFNNLGPNAVKVKDNTFINIDGYTQSCAAVAIGKNSNYINGSIPSYGQVGLEFRCNNFDDNPYALSVIDGNIRKYQGEFGASSGSDYAGNAFDHYGSNLARDFYVKVPINSYWEIPLYQYYSHSDNSHKLIDQGVGVICSYTASRVSNNIGTFVFQDSHCEEGDGGGIIIKGMSVGEGSDLIEDADTEIMLKEYELSEATDNGQTYTLISEVETMTSQNSTEVAETIAELDGYISDELAISLMQNEQANQFAKAGALLENSPLPVSVKDELDNMEMNPTLKQIIKDNQNGTNPRNAKELEIAELKQYRSLVISEMYNSAINNDSVPAEKEALETFLQKDNNLQSKVHLYNLYKHNRNFVAANATLNTIKLSLANEDLDYRIEMENYLELEKIMLDIEFGHANLNEAVANNFELIDFIANNESYAGQVSAQLLLQEAGLAEYSELIKLPEPDVAPKNAVINNKPTLAVKYDNIINVYPNPAGEVFYVEYALLEDDSNASIQILSLNGSVIENIELKQNAGIFVYNKKLAAGTYIIKVGNNYTQKININ